MIKDIRIVYMGTPDFAVAPLKTLVEAGYNIVGVVTVPDKPAGRGQKVQSSPVKIYAQEKGLKILQPEKLKNPDFINEFVSLSPDIAVVVAFRMLPESIWSIPRLGTFNLHASLLPHYRGAAPINWAIINGEKKTGVTTFLIDKEIDTGNIIYREEIDIDSNHTAGDIHDKLMVIGAKLVLKTVQSLTEKKVNPIDQQLFIQKGEQVKSAPKIFRETCRIDWTKTASDVHNFIRGLSPYPGAWTELIFEDGAIVQVKLLKSVEIEKNHQHTNGSVLIEGKNTFNVACDNGFVSIIEMQLAGKRPMKINEFLNGLRNIAPIKMI
ncbi:MAG: methionyl-tRNA formyltransferase [Bacteroidia bacterium]|nr:methionyl-tRNA formyltransferase [Bacteroidia bacterium]